VKPWTGACPSFCPLLDHLAAERAIAREAHSKQQYGQAVPQRAEAELLHRYGDLDLTTELVRTPASPALLKRGESASLLVLGSRGLRAPATFLLGSISLHVPCPVAVVPHG